MYLSLMRCSVNTTLYMPKVKINFQERSRSAFRSLYPFVFHAFVLNDSEIDFFINHHEYSYRLYLANALIEEVFSWPYLKRVACQDPILSFIRKYMFDDNVLPF